MPTVSIWPPALAAARSAPVINNFAADGILITTTGNAVQLLFGYQRCGHRRGHPADGRRYCRHGRNQKHDRRHGRGRRQPDFGKYQFRHSPSNAAASDNLVAGNLIGTDITGTVPIANATGVEIDTATSGNTIGGMTEAVQYHFREHVRGRSE